jgi:hypothetical protein
MILALCAATKTVSLPMHLMADSPALADNIFVADIVS